MKRLSTQLSTLKLSNFSRWLRQQGAEVLTNTSRWEMLRFKHDGITSIIYRNDHHSYSAFTGEAEEAINRFMKKRKWPSKNKNGSLNNSKKHSILVNTLLQRDGENCFFCKKSLEEDISLEHLISLTVGGKHHLANLVLSHIRCNSEADTLSIMDKIKIRERTK